MMLRVGLALLLLAPLTGGPIRAQATKGKDLPKADARLVVDDGGGMFSAEGIKKAKTILAEVHDHYLFEMTILTFKDMPAEKKKTFEKLTTPAEKQRLFNDWAVEEAKGRKARGVFVLVCRSPGYVHVIADKAIRDKGLTARDEELVKNFLLEKFREAKEQTEEEQDLIRDKGLRNAVEFVRDAYKKMVK